MLSKCNWKISIFLNPDSEEVVHTLNSSPILISNSIEELKTEVVKQLLNLENGDVISLRLVRAPVEQDTSDMNKLVEDSSVDTKNTSDKPLCY